MSNQLNFSQQMDEVLKTLGGTRPRLLLHACCGPCSSAVLERLCPLAVSEKFGFGKVTRDGPAVHRVKVCVLFLKLTLK